MGRRRVQKIEGTRFDNPRQRLYLTIAAVGGVLVAVLGGLFAVNASFPDLWVNLTRGFPKQVNDRPRGMELWVVYPDDTVRQITAYYLAENPAGVSRPYGVAGPYVNSPEDILDVKYFGALTATQTIKPGESNDTSRFFVFVDFEPDFAAGVYGINVLTRNSPYMEADQRNPRIRMLGLGARQNMDLSYYQYLVGIALPPGAQVESLAHSTSLTPDTAEKMLRPYRRAEISGWAIYFYDTSELPELPLPERYIIRIRYVTPTDTAIQQVEPTFWEVYAQR